MEKDPYLSELDAIDDLESPTQVEEGHSGRGVEEATHVDRKVPVAASRDTALASARGGSQPPSVEEPTDGSESAPVDFPEVSEIQADAPVKEILDLSPDISVPLVIVMGRKNYTVKDLLALRMGQVMDLNRAPMEPVDLVAAGRVIGKGELVEIEGKLGVRILKLLK